MEWAKIYYIPQETFDIPKYKVLFFNCFKYCFHEINSNNNLLLL